MQRAFVISLKKAIESIELIIESNQESHIAKAQEYFEKYPNLQRAAIAASLMGDRYNGDKEGVEAARIIGLGEILDFFGESNETSVRDMAHILEPEIDRPPLEAIKECDQIVGDLAIANRQLRTYGYRTIYYVEAPLGHDDLWAMFHFYFDGCHFDEELAELTEDEGKREIRILVTRYVHREMEEQEDPEKEGDFYFFLGNERSLNFVKRSIRAFLLPIPKFKN